MFLQLQPLTADRLPAALELDQKCFGGLWTAEGYQRELDSPNSELLVFSAVPDDQTDSAKVASEYTLAHPLLGLGCYWAILEEAHITILAIEPSCHRQGLGQALLYALLASAHQRGLERATLEVRASNQAALSLYSKFGFQVAGQRRRYYQDTGEDALVLWRGGLQYPQFPQQIRDWYQQSNDRLQRAGWSWLRDQDFITFEKTSLT